jgi:translation initiation factor 2B subunit (eIF-2B alpha/beta/delta family)
MDRFTSSVDTLLADNTSGSGDLLTFLTDSIKGLADRQETKSKLDARKFRGQLVRIREGKPVFLVLQHFTGALTGFLGDKSFVKIDALKAFIDAYTEEWKDVNERITSNVHQVTGLAGMTILVHSNSSTVCSLLGSTQSAASGIRIIQTESRPVMEGRIQGRRLADLGYQVKMITDASIFMYIQQADIAILGADAVYPEYFINKSGSHSVALACREYGKNCLVVCDSRKLWFNQHENAVSLTGFGRPAPPEELWADPPGNITIENYYFEKIPVSLVSKFVFENRIVEGRNISSLTL